ncbi:MAG: glycosyltransferase [Planctomycetes bacterium]|nr:glycosyltransferase [Planctomycetota bacterium]
MTPARTSVLLPVHNAAETLPACLESLAWQTERGFEVVAVDDASTDGSPELLERAAAADSRIRVLRREGPPDLVAALELGRAAAEGRYLLRMDADDLAHPQRLELQQRALDRDPRVAAVGSLVRSFPHVTPGRLRYDRWLNGLRTHADMARERFVESPLAHPSVLLRAEPLERIGGYRAIAGPEDYDLWLRMLGAGLRLAKVPRTLLFWRDGEGRASRRDPRYRPDGFARVRAEALAALVGGRPVCLVGAGTAGRRLARQLLQRGVELQAFWEVDPKKVGRAPYGIEVLPHAEGVRRRGDALVFSCVNAWGARQRVRGWLREAGLTEGRDFFLAG